MLVIDAKEERTEGGDPDGETLIARGQTRIGLPDRVPDEPGAPNQPAASPSMLVR